MKRVSINSQSQPRIRITSDFNPSLSPVVLEDELSAVVVEEKSDKNKLQEMKNVRDEIKAREYYHGLPKIMPDVA